MVITIVVWQHHCDIRKSGNTGCRSHKQNLNDAKNIGQKRAIKSWALHALNQSRFYKCNIQTNYNMTAVINRGLALVFMVQTLACFAEAFEVRHVIIILIRIIVDTAIMNSIVYQLIFHMRFRRWYLGLGSGLGFRMVGCTSRILVTNFFIYSLWCYL